MSWRGTRVRMVEDDDRDAGRVGTLLASWDSLDGERLCQVEWDDDPGRVRLYAHDQLAPA